MTDDWRTVSAAALPPGTSVMSAAAPSVIPGSAPSIGWPRALTPGRLATRRCLTVEFDHVSI